MGANFFTIKAEGFDSSLVFNDLCNEAEEEYGCSHYNGTISTTTLTRVIKISEFFSQENKKGILKTANNTIEYLLNSEELSSRECVCLDLGISHYVAFSVKKGEKINQKPAVYKQKYVICDSETDKILYYYDKISDAKNKAIEIASSGINVSLQKKPVLIDGSPIIETYDTVTKTFTKKPKMKKCLIKEVHQYMYVGWASS